MGLFFGLLVGFFSGLALVAGLKYVMSVRSKARIFKAVGLSLLGGIEQDDIKRLCSSNYPPWLSFSTFEKVKWMNKMLEKIWPSVAKAASELIKMNVEPMLALYCPPGFKMKFSKLFLGTVAPKIDGIRMQTLEKGKVIMDLDFKWGGDPSIILAVQTPVGATLPIQLKDLRFFAKVRVIYKLAEDIPCIAGVAVALLAEPKAEIRYTLKLIGGSLSGVPGISDVISNMVEDAVSDSLEWPHRIVVPIAQTPVDLSDLDLKLQGRLRITDLKGHSLKNLEMIGKSDPYVIAYVRVLFKDHTKTVENNLNPVWNDVLEFDVEDQETQALVLQVMDEDNLKADKLMGFVKVPLAKLKPEETIELKHPLMASLDNNVKEKQDRGSISFKVHYHVYNVEEQIAAMEAEKALVEVKKKAAEANLIGGTVDVIGGAVGGAGKLVVGGVGMVGSGIMKGGKFVTKSMSSSFVVKRRNSGQENGVPDSPKQ